MRRSKFEKTIAIDDAERKKIKQKFFDAVNNSEAYSDLILTDWYWITIHEIHNKGFNSFYYNSSNYEEGVKKSAQNLVEMVDFIDDKILMIDKIKKQIERNKENWERFKENPTMFLVAQDYGFNNNYIFAYEINKDEMGIEVNGFDSQEHRNILKNYNYPSYNLRPMEYDEFENFYIPNRCKAHVFTSEEELVNYVNYLRNLWHESMDKIDENERKKYRDTDAKYYL